MVDKAEVEKEQKLKAALDRVNALEQELTETKKVNSWYSWIQISKLARKIINPKEEKSRHFLFFSFFQALEEARVKQDELLACVGKEKKLVCLVNTYNLLGKLKFVFISVLFYVNIWPCSGFGVQGLFCWWGDPYKYCLPICLWATFEWQELSLHIEKASSSGLVLYYIARHRCYMRSSKSSNQNHTPNMPTPHRNWSLLLG